MSELQWSDQHAWDPEHSMPGGYYVRADPYTVCKIGSRHDTSSTRTRWRFEVWRGTVYLKTCDTLSEARRFAEAHHRKHGSDPITHDRKE